MRWSFLSGLNDGRLFSIYADDARGIVGTGGATEMFAAIAAMYLLIPVLSFYMVNIAVNAASIGISQFLSPGGGRGAGVLAAAAFGARVVAAPVAAGIERLREGRPARGGSQVPGDSGGGGPAAGGGEAAGGGSSGGMRSS